MPPSPVYQSGSMRPMVIDRRAFLGGGAALIGAAALAGPASASVTPQLFAAARRDADGFAAAVFDANGRDVRRIALPGRGHDVAFHAATGRCVAFARRPGNFAVAFSASGRQLPIAFTTPADRHFYGHGVFSRDGQLLYATENDYDGARGCIGIYDAAGRYQRVGELPSGGIGPHDVQLSQDGRHLIVANGGIETHPDIGRGRAKLNLATMSPNIARVSLASGEMVETLELSPDLAKVSLRHLELAGQQRIVVGAQTQRGAPGDAPIAFASDSRGRLVPLVLPRDISKRMQNYVSSIAVDAAGEVAAVTSARGATVAFFDLGTRRYLGHRLRPDVSGIAPARSGFLITSGAGDIATATPNAPLSINAATAHQWDNHARALTDPA